jgi:hypothetical protein
MAIGNELPGTPELSSSGFRQMRVTLTLGDTTPFKQATRTVVAILPMSGSATIEREGGSATVLSTAGAFTDSCCRHSRSVAPCVGANS